MAKKWPDDFRNIKESLPAWIIFYNLVGYDYFPEERVKGQVEDMIDLAQRVRVEPVQAIGRVSASELLKVVQAPSEDPYWKLRYKGACQDIFFLTIYDKLPELIKTMHDTANEAGYPGSEIGMYLQPIVQGSNLHCEFNLFYDQANRRESEKVKEITCKAIRSLMDRGTFFSRPYGENTNTIMNRDAATVSALKKVKKILDPDNIMNPGKLCF